MVAPELAQRPDHDMQLLALLGQHVLLTFPRPLLTIGAAFEDSFVDEHRQPCGEHVGRHTETAGELREPAVAPEGFADDEQSPLVAQELEVRAMEQRAGGVADDGLM